ncbi:hypothetical protein F5888DRAFT_1856172 [Russula emetica]|nr:hypothetical protein F5888DRAFT_1856172 [Russula emetica]
MHKLLVAFVSVVTLMGLVEPSSAYAIQERNGDRLARGLNPLAPTRRDDGSHPQPSHHFEHNHHGQYEQRNNIRLARGLSGLPPTRRDDAKHPHPSHQFKHKDLGNYGHGDDEDDNGQGGHQLQERNSDRLARGLPPLPPTRRDGAKHPQPSHQFKHKDLANHGHGDDDEDDNGQGGPQYQQRNSDRLARGLPPLPPTRRDSSQHPHPSYGFKFKYHGHDDDQGENDNGQGHENKQRDSVKLARDLPPTRRDNAQHPHPSNPFKHPHPPTRRDSAEHPHPSHYFKYKNHGHGDDDQGHKRQERNSERLARGLPPLPPTRRNSARGPQPSKHKQQGDVDGSERIELRDTDGSTLGYLTDFTGSGEDLSVNYHPEAHTLSFHGDNLGDADFLGASVSKTDLGPNSPAFVYLTNVGDHDSQANADIWSLDGNKLTATWKNSDGTTAPLRFCLNSAGNSIVLAGDPSLLSGYKEVDMYLDN